jgi:hypothetical protein
MDNPEKLAQMLQQQQAMKFLQSLQGGMANGMQGAGAMSEMDRMQMAQGAMQPQDAMQGQMPVQQPQGDYGMPMPQQSYSATMPTNPPQMDRRGMLQGAVNSLGAQGMGQGLGQGAMSNKDLEMMRRR